MYKKGKQMRILFLADRNILVDDPMKKEFSQFGNKMTKLQNKNDVAKAKSFEMFFGIYQGITSNQISTNEIYKKFSKDFFDLIVVDECHRGSAAADSAWREILEYFNKAIQIGLTATPKETVDISKYLKATDRYAKTIVFCVDIEHAVRMTQALINENSDLFSQYPKYIMRITGDNEIGKAELENFTSPKEKFPVIVTTSKLLTTGVDIQTCRLIVLDSLINSMTEFKQIIGRGTRINEEYKKYHFTIIDFRGTTNLFADPDFDGDPVKIYEAKESDPIHSAEDDYSSTTNQTGNETNKEQKNHQSSVLKAHSKQNKIYVNNVEVNIVNERVQYIGKDGKLITESLKDYSKKGILQEYKTLSEFLKHWKKSERKQIIIQELEEKGILLHELQIDVGKEYDEFDLICHVAFDEKPLTRKERARKVPKETYFQKYGEKIKAVLDAILIKYSDEGILTIEDNSVLKLSPFNKMGSPIEIIKLFGNKEKYLEFIKDIKDDIYRAA